HARAARRARARSARRRTSTRTARARSRARTALRMGRERAKNGGAAAMSVGIDARKIADFGIGTYIRGLLGALADLGGDETYVAFAPANASLPPGVEHVVVDAPHYSVRELFAVGRAADGAGLGVFHAAPSAGPYQSV